MYTSFLDVLKNWFAGEDIIHSYTLWGIRCLWYSRAGQLFQFIGGLTLLVEILGIEKIKLYKEEVGRAIQSRSQRDLFRVHIMGFIYKIEFAFLGNPIKKFIRSSLRGARHYNYDKLSRYRELVMQWKVMRQKQYQKVLIIRRRSRAYKGLTKNIAYTVTFLFLAGTTLSTWKGIMGLFQDTTSLWVLIPVGFCAALISFIVAIMVSILMTLILETLIILVLILLTTPYLIFFLLLKFMILMPLYGFFSLSKNERLYKLVSLLTVAVGFFLTLIFS
jgi:hypothetical protein